MTIHLHATRTDCPSNLLYRNEVRDFGHAMELVIQQCDEEIAASLNVPEFLPDDPDGSEFRKQVNAYRGAARAAMLIWRQGSSAAEIASIFRILPSADENHDMIAEAAETGDYSRLAI